MCATHCELLKQLTVRECRRIVSSIGPLREHVSNADPSCHAACCFHLKKKYHTCQCVCYYKGTSNQFNDTFHTHAKNNINSLKHYQPQILSKVMSWSRSVVLATRWSDNLCWNSGTSMFGIPGLPSKKGRKEEENAGCAGNTRSVVRSVSLVPRDCDWWCQVPWGPSWAHSKASEVAAQFGQKEFEGPPSEIVDRWRASTRQLLGPKGPSEPLDFKQ